VGVGAKPQGLKKNCNRKEPPTSDSPFLKRRYFYGVTVYLNLRGKINCTVKIFRGFSQLLL
jgi:hypothetical protein